MPMLRILLLAVGCVAGIAAPLSSAAAGCSEPRLQISDASKEEAQIICRAVAKARMILAQCGLTSNQALHIEVRGESAPRDGMHDFAAYNSVTKMIRIAKLGRMAEMVKPGTIYAQIPPPSLYEAIAVHEVAHAIVFENLNGRIIQRTAHEYIAYVTQFSALDDALRHKLIAQFASSPWRELEAFGELMLMMAPHRFGLQAYSHFRLPNHGCPFVRDIIAGLVRFPVIESKRIDPGRPTGPRPLGNGLDSSTPWR